MQFMEYIAITFIVFFLIFFRKKNEKFYRLATVLKNIILAVCRHSPYTTQKISESTIKLLKYLSFFLPTYLIKYNIQYSSHKSFQTSTFPYIQKIFI